MNIQDEYVEEVGNFAAKSIKSAAESLQYFRHSLQNILLFDQVIKNSQNTSSCFLAIHNYYLILCSSNYLKLMDIDNN